MRSFNMMLVLFATVFITIMLTGATLDKILMENVRTQVVDEVNEKHLKFQNPADKQVYLENEIQVQDQRARFERRMVFSN